MSHFTSTDRVLPHEILDRLEWEMSARTEIGGISSERGWGRIGGRMVRVTLRNAEEAMRTGGAHL